MAEPPPSILLCEDDREIRDLLAAFLAAEGFLVDALDRPAALDARLAARAFDLVILDWMLPGEDGVSVCRRLRARGGPPVLMLTARSEDEDRITGLENGADAYVSKPFNTRVLLAQIRAVLRAARPSPGVGATARAGDLAVDLVARRVTCGEVEVGLTSGEYDLLMCFVDQPQRVLSREHLIGCTRGRTTGLFDRSLDVQLSRLRGKLTAAGSGAAGAIRAVRNAGYILAAPVERG